MSKLISNNAIVCKQGEIIMNINSMANKKKSKGEQVTNASIGMLFDENKVLANFEIVYNLMVDSLKDSKTREYDSITGNKDYEKAIIKWLFKDANMEGSFLKVCATLGATGALSLSTRIYANNNQEILLPSIRWGNYDSIANQAGCSYLVYNLFDDKDGFDVKSLKEKVLESCKKYQRAYVLINDPCQNPSGYSLSEKEWDDVLEVLKEVSKDYPIVLVDDVAYIDFMEGDYTPIFEKFAKVVNDNFIINVCFSASKTLQIYGLRGGALVNIASSKELSDEFATASKTYCRSTWSSPNHLTTTTMSKIFLDEDNSKKISSKLKEFRKMVKDRADIFEEEAKEVNLPYYPYRGGFFILVKCPNNEEVANKLANRNLFIVPMCNSLRISIASISKKETIGLAKAIKECMEAN